MANNTKKIESKTLLVLNEGKNDEHGKGIELRVVEWIVEGKHYPQLEKREFFKDDEGNWKMGKAKGMNDQDFIVVIKNWNKICTLMKIDPPFLANVFNSVSFDDQPAATLPEESLPSEQQEEF